MYRLMAKYCIFLIFILVTMNWASAQMQTHKPVRLKLGFYAHSVNDMASLSDIEVSMNFWAKEYMVEGAKEQGIEIAESGAVLFDTISEMRAAVDRNEIDIIIAPPILLVQYFKREELKNGFTGMLSNNRPDSLLVISRRDKHIEGITDFKGKHFLIPTNDEFADMYLDSLFLEHFHQSVNKFAGSIDRQSKANRIVLDIYFNKADIGIVYQNAFEVTSELNPDIAKQLKVIEQYPIKSRNFSFFVNNYPLATEMASLAENSFKGSIRAKQILEVFKTPELAICSVEELEPFENFLRHYQALKKKYRQ